MSGNASLCRCLQACVHVLVLVEARAEPLVSQVLSSLFSEMVSHWPGACSTRYAGQTVLGVGLS